MWSGKTSVLLLLLPVACAAPEVVDDTTTTTTYGWTGTTLPQPTTSTTTGNDEDTEAATTEGPATTTTGHPDTTGILPDFGGEGLGCGGKIDFLFVLDRWKLSEPYWARMDAALEEMRPKFVDWFANFDTHWMVVDGLNYWGLWNCPERCAETNGATCTPTGPAEYPCEPYNTNSISDCDEIEGAGRTFPAGFGSSNKRCELAGGNRFASSKLESDLDATLECLTAVGYSDGFSTAELAMVEALKPAMTKVPGGCNLGFLRDDALLVIVLFTPYAGVEGSSPVGNASEWAEKVYAAKFGDKDKVAVIGIVRDFTQEEPTVCEKLGTLLNQSLVEQFLNIQMTHSVFGSICAESYTPTLEDGMRLALELCGADPPT
ncbi:MAG: hypothetical protein ACPG4T_21880 [Nannocystaceae bacterium]